MTPGNYVYFDHSQTKNEDSVTIGSYTPVQETYGYEPQSKLLTPEQAKYIIGAQGNVWTEYMKNPRKVEYMIFPRLSALSEVLWSPKAKRNLSDFEKRLKIQFRRFELWGANFSKAFYDLKADIIPANNYSGVLWALQGKEKNRKIQVNYWSKDNTISLNIPETKVGETLMVLTDAYIKDSFIYNSPIKIKSSGFYEAFEIRSENGQIEQLRHLTTQRFFINKASGKKIKLTSPPGENFPGNGGAFGLVNGAVSDKGQNSSEWLGWQGKDLDATIDLGKSEKISKVNVHILTARGSQPCNPQFLEVSTSADGKTYKSIGKTTEIISDSLSMGKLSLSFNPTTTRFVKVKVKNFGTIPDGMPGAGNKAWLYADEIQIE